MRPPYVLILLVASSLNIATACAVQPAPPSVATLETPLLIVSQAACETTDSQPASDLRMPPRPTHLLGGGLITEEQFTFDLWLYCDPALSPEAEGALSSEIGGLGIHLAWRYHGSETIGHTESFLGFNGDNEPRAVWEAGLAPGTVGSFTGGVRSLNNDLTEAVRSGVPITFKAVVTVEDKIYGATLTFTMVPASDGYRPSEIAVVSL